MIQNSPGYGITVYCDMVASTCLPLTVYEGIAGWPDVRAVAGRMGWRTDYGLEGFKDWCPAHRPPMTEPGGTANLPTPGSLTRVGLKVVTPPQMIPVTQTGNHLSPKQLHAGQHAFTRRHDKGRTWYERPRVLKNVQWRDIVLTHLPAAFSTTTTALSNTTTALNNFTFTITCAMHPWQRRVL